MAKRYLNKEWKNSMKLRLDYNNMMDEFVGTDGITRKELNSYKYIAGNALEKVRKGQRLARLDRFAV